MDVFVTRNIPLWRGNHHGLWKVQPELDFADREFAIIGA
jgi:hypothetical protein